MIFFYSIELEYLNVIIYMIYLFIYITERNLFLFTELLCYIIEESWAKKKK